MKKRGRPRADYKCAISGRVCPFSNYDFSVFGDAVGDNCPILKYERGDFIRSNGRKVISDWCKHAELRGAVMEDKKKEVQEALVKMGYAFGFVRRFQLKELDDTRVEVICDGKSVGIYDFIRHTFVD